MSRSMLYLFRNDAIDGGYEFKNSFGTGAMVWQALATRYESILFPERRSFERGNFITDAPVLFEKNQELGMREWETWVYLFMCDLAIVRREAFKELADALDRFDDAHSRPNFVCHLRWIAGKLRAFADPHHTNVQAAAMYCTSVGDDAWFTYDEESDEEKPYNFVTGDKHFFVEVEARRRADIVTRAEQNCIQDQCENIPFASIGGLEKRGDMVAPDYIDEKDRALYLAGYRTAARLQYGDDWKTCEFSWSPTITIGGAS